MNLRTKTIALLSLLRLASVTLAQVDVPGAPQWQATFHVVDEAGMPVTNATVYAGYYIPPPPNRSEAGARKTGLTDASGIVILAAHSGPAIACGVTKSGYYATTGIGYDFDARNHTNGQWHPWNPEITIQLKKIGTPIPMYAKIEETKIPKQQEPIGYDLISGDWVSPYGHGKTADMFFTLHREIVNDHEYDAELKLTFPNAGDGISVAPAEPNTGSTFRTARTAPATDYQPQRVWHYSGSLQPEPVFGYFFRVRTVLDENGNIKSALYGKIRGDFRFYVGTRAPQAGMGFDYYVNPTPNDLNVEFDPKRNLLGGQNVTAP
jgi:hypothetical protein